MRESEILRKAVLEQIERNEKYLAQKEKENLLNKSRRTKTK